MMCLISGFSSSAGSEQMFGSESRGRFGKQLSLLDSKSRENLLRFIRTPSAAGKAIGPRQSRFGNPSDHLLRFSRTPNSEHLLRFSRQPESDHMLRFSRSRGGGNDDHMLRFSRSQGAADDDHMLRFSRSQGAADDDHMLRFSRSGSRAGGGDDFQLRFSRTPDDHLLRFSRSSAGSAANDEHLLRFSRSTSADDQAAGASRFARALINSQDWNRYNEGGQNHFLRFNRALKDDEDVDENAE